MRKAEAPQIPAPPMGELRFHNNSYAESDLSPSATVMSFSHEQGSRSLSFPSEPKLIALAPEYGS